MLLCLKDEIPRAWMVLINLFFCHEATCSLGKHLYKFRTITFWIGYIHPIYREDGGSGFLRHVGKCLLYYTV